jgi:hypothetical protein
MDVESFKGDENAFCWCLIIFLCCFWCCYLLVLEDVETYAWDEASRCGYSNFIKYWTCEYGYKHLSVNIRTHTHIFAHKWISNFSPCGDHSDSSPLILNIYLFCVHLHDIIIVSCSQEKGTIMCIHSSIYHISYACMNAHSTLLSKSSLTTTMMWCCCVYCVCFTLRCYSKY